MERTCLGIREHSALPVALKKRMFKYNFSVMAIILCDKVIWIKRKLLSGPSLHRNTSRILQPRIQYRPALFRHPAEHILESAVPGDEPLFRSGDHHKSQRIFFLATRYLSFLSFPWVSRSDPCVPIIHYLYGHQFIGASDRFRSCSLHRPSP